jgi:hypothetical protein
LSVVPVPNAFLGKHFDAEFNPAAKEKLDSFRTERQRGQGRRLKDAKSLRHWPPPPSAARLARKINLG